MKKFYFLFCAAFFFSIVGCSNESPATTSPATSTPVTSTPPAKPLAQKKQEKIVVVQRADTAKTTVSLGKSGGSVKTKKGTEVTVGQGVIIGTKDVKIDIKRDN